MLFSIQMATCFAQRNSQRSLQTAIIDSVLSRISRLLVLNQQPKRAEYPTRIRITDLTGCYPFEGGYFNNINYTIVKKVPFNLNNGIFRDVLFYEQKQVDEQIRLNVFLCEFEPNFFIQRLYNYHFLFIINHQGIQRISQTVQVIE